MTGLKQRDLNPCLICGQGVMHTGVPICYRITMEVHGFDLEALQRQHGLEMSMGAAAPLAQHMGPDNDLTKVVDTASGLVCMDCAKRSPILAMQGN